MILRIDNTLFESIFTREYRGVVSAARRICGVAAAEDIAQETFAALYRAGPSDPAHARNWLYQVVIRRAIVALRAETRRKTREIALLVDRQTPDRPDQVLERSELSAEVRGVLQRLKRRYAVVLALRHSGMSYREIADVIEVKPGQVGTLLIRAEAAFKKELSHVPLT